MFAIDENGFFKKLVSVVTSFVIKDAENRGTKQYTKEGPNYDNKQRYASREFIWDFSLRWIGDGKYEHVAHRSNITESQTFARMILSMRFGTQKK